MPEIAVAIEWDWPDEPHWLNADNVAEALNAHCGNTKFQVRQLVSEDVPVGDVEGKPSISE